MGILKHGAHGEGLGPVSLRQVVLVDAGKMGVKYI